MFKKKLKISIVGLGYVGLPLAVSFSKYYKVFGFDLNKYRINNLQKGYDETLEVNKATIGEIDIQFYKIFIEKEPYFIINHHMVMKIF